MEEHVGRVYSTIAFILGSITCVIFHSFEANVSEKAINNSVLNSTLKSLLILIEYL